jgi:uncharacterized membrane protein
MTPSELLPLIGIPVVVVGFLLRLNPLLVVTGAGVVTGIAVGIAPLDLLELVGVKFLGARSLTFFVLLLPVVGLLERYGLRQQATRLIAKFRRASPGRILLAYFGLRQLAAATGVQGIGGYVTTVRPLLAPMLEGAATARLGPLPDRTVAKLRSEAAATENVALFFGEDIFIAFSGVLLMEAFLRENGIHGIDPIQIGLWAIPSAIAAFLIHGFRLMRLDAVVARDVAQSQDQ